jgi:hypothetical protein
MPIVISNAPVKPAITYDKVHLRELRIVLTEDNVSKANVRIVYSLFGRDADGVKYLDKAQHVVVVDDAFTEAAVKAQAGNPALAQALGGIEAAIAAILNEQGGYGTVTVAAE